MQVTGVVLADEMSREVCGGWRIEVCPRGIGS
jgi:hypothetical protein